MKKRLLFLLLALALVVSCLPAAQVQAAENTVVYNGNDMAPFAGRTKEQIAQRYCEARYSGPGYINGDTSTYYSRPASLKAPYDQGAISEDTAAVMNAMTNYYRWLTGVAPMTGLTGNRDDLQKGALVRNWDFNHRVSSERKPADMDQTLWNEGASVAHNIIAMGYTPRGVISGWLNEGYRLSGGSWDTLGHRAAILGACYSGISYGFSGRVAIGVDTGYNNSFPDNAFAAYPAPGYMPVNELTAYGSAWSVELNNAVLKISDINGVKVTVTNLTTNQGYDCTCENGKLVRTNGLVGFVQPACQNTYYYADGESFRVQITGLTDVATGKNAEIDYTVNFFDVTAYGSSYVTGYSSANGWNRVLLTANNATADNLAILAAVLPEQVEVTTELGRTCTLPVRGSWSLDQANQCWTNTVGDLPEGITDPDGVLSEVKISYEVNDYTGSFSLGGSSFSAGQTSKVYLWRYMLSTNRADIYHISGKSAQEYKVEKIYDNDSDAFSVESSGYWCWNHTWTMQDEGRWLALYYSDNYFRGDVYLAGISSVSITCPHTNTRKETTSPTCTQAGEERTICNDCGALVSTKQLNAPGHSFSQTVVTEPTCTAQGYTTHICSVCAESYKDTYTAALGHDWDEGVVLTEPTETENGSKSLTCTRCGETKTVIIPSLSHVHSYTAAVTSPTCAQNGYTTYICECGQTYIADMIDALGHDYVQGVCTRCGENDPNYQPPTSKDPCEGYTDINRSGWYHGAADFAISRGIMGSTQKNTLTFEPNTACTRSMIVSILYRLSGSPAVQFEAKFPDVEAGKWFSDAVIWAYQNGIVSGYGNGNFGPNDKITREQMAVILKGYAQYMEKNTDKAADLSRFPDCGKVTWSKAAVCWAVGEGLISGKAQNGRNYLDPQGNAARAEVASILMRFIQNIIEK